MMMMGIKKKNVVNTFYYLLVYIYNFILTFLLFVIVLIYY